MPNEPSAQSSVSQARFRVENYGFRSFAVYDGDELVVVAVYKCGAIALAKKLDSALGGGVEVRKRERSFINPIQ